MNPRDSAVRSRRAEQLVCADCDHSEVMLISVVYPVTQMGTRVRVGGVGISVPSGAYIYDRWYYIMVLLPRIFHLL